MMKEEKKKYVTPSVSIHEIEASPMLAGSPGGASASPSVDPFGEGGNLGGGELEPSSASRRSSLWD